MYLFYVFVTIYVINKSYFFSKFVTNKKYYYKNNIESESSITICQANKISVHIISFSFFSSFSWQLWKMDYWAYACQLFHPQNHHLRPLPYGMLSFFEFYCHLMQSYLKQVSISNYLLNLLHQMQPVIKHLLIFIKMFFSLVLLQPKLLSRFYYLVSNYCRQLCHSFTIRYLLIHDVQSIWDALKVFQ